MKYLLFAISVIIPSMANASVLYVRCENYGDRTTCIPESDGKKFVRLNGIALPSSRAADCTKKLCNFITPIPSNTLKLGNNLLSFAVITDTSDANMQTHHRYTFVLDSVEIYSFDSRRTGDEVDKRSFSLDLSLKQLDPELARRVDRLIEKRGEYDRKVYEAIDRYKEIDEEEERSRERILDLENQLSQLSASNFDEISTDLLKKLSIELKFYETLKSNKDLLIKNNEKHDPSLASRYGSTAGEVEEINRRLNSYGTSLENLGVSLTLPESSEREARAEDSGEVSVEGGHLVNTAITKLESLINSYNKSAADQNLDQMEKIYKEWKLLNPYVWDIVSSIKGLDTPQKRILYDKIGVAVQAIGICETEDYWYRDGGLSKASKEYIDSEIQLGNSQFKLIKSKFNFQKFNDEYLQKSREVLARSQSLNERIKGYPEATTEDVNVKEIARASLKVSNELFAESMDSQDLDKLETASNTLSIGDEVLNISLGFIPGVGTAASLYEAFTGKTPFGDHQLSPVERGISLVAAFVPMFGGVVGKKIASKSVKSFGYFSNIFKKIASKIRGFDGSVVNEMAQTGEAIASSAAKLG
ncbi:MAG: pre-toxin TG domain-containing protein [Bdellovibrionales bacterium]|nr:pre-toxin TG domain-containing protein [Bdellovibrionales bacterium]